MAKRTQAKKNLTPTSEPTETRQNHAHEQMMHFFTIYMRNCVSFGFLKVKLLDDTVVLVPQGELAKKIALLVKESGVEHES